jgi:hypothetical protein
MPTDIFDTVTLSPSIPSDDWDHHRDEFQLGQIAQRLGLVRFVDVDDLSELRRKS